MIYDSEYIYFCMPEEVEEYAETTVKINDSVIINNNEYIVREASIEDCCKGCCFEDTEYCTMKGQYTDLTGFCGGIDREDGKDVIFEKLNRVS